jgi:hypothetical protein
LQNDAKKDVLETEIISQSGLPAADLRNYLSELEWQNLVKEDSLDQATQNSDYGL